jgi:hypothetical protein
VDGDETSVDAGGDLDILSLGSSSADDIEEDDGTGEVESADCLEGEGRESKKEERDIESRTFIDASCWFMLAESNCFNVPSISRIKSDFSFCACNNRSYLKQEIPNQNNKR